MKDQQIGYFFIVFASVIIVLAGIKSASVIVVPFLLSLFIAIILSPLFNFFKNRGLPDWFSITVVMALFILLLALVAKLIGTSIHDFSANIDFYSDRLTLYYNALLEYGERLGVDIPLEEIATMINSKEIMGFATGLIKSLSSLFTDGFVILLTVVFMLLESKHFLEKIDYADGERDTIVYIKEIMGEIKSYMVIKALISLLTGLIVWIALLFIGTDYAFLWGVLAFLLNFIPNIGSIIAAVPAVLITLVQLGPLSALIVSFVYLFVNIVIGSIIEPKVMGKGVGLSTLVVFLSLLFWGWLLGMVGMLLSIPLTIMAKIAFNANEKTKWIAVLLGTGENLNPKAKK